MKRVRLTLFDTTPRGPFARIREARKDGQDQKTVTRSKSQR
jgi:hypothetical protein